MPKTTKTEALAQPKGDGQQGELYVSISSGKFVAPAIDIERVLETLQNHAVADEFDKLAYQVFPGFYEINIYGPDGNKDDDLSDQALKMMERPTVKLWERMKSTWRDCFTWGIAVTNPVWSVNGAQVDLAQIRRLPPEGFSLSPSVGLNSIYAPLLPGIILNEKGEVEYHQAQNAPAYMTVKLDASKLFVVKSAGSTEFYGQSKLLPLIPLLNVYNFAWQAQTQKLNRIGAPVVFIRVMNPVGDDMKYADAVLKNWGSSTAFKLRGNMEIVELKGNESEVALSTIQAIEQLIKRYFSPVSIMQKEGNTIGGNAEAEKSIFDLYVRGIHQWIQSEYEKLVEQWLQLNGMVDYEAEIIIEEQGSSAGQVESEQAKVGYDTKSMTVNEIRNKLGLAEMSDEELAALAEETKGRAPPNPFGNPFGQPQSQPAPPGQPPDIGAAGSKSAPSLEPKQQKEHEPTVIEKDLELDIAATIDNMAQKVYKALLEESKP